MLSQQRRFISNFKFYFFSLAATLLIVGLAQAQTGPPGTPGEPSHGRHVTDEILVRYKPGTSTSQMAAVEAGAQASWRSSGWHGQVMRLRIRPNSSVEEMLIKFRGNPLVEYAEPNFIAEISAVLPPPNDPMYWLQWNLEDATSGSVHAESAWDITAGFGTVVAVLDTGIAFENYTQGSSTYCQAPDLSGTCFVQGRDFVNNDDHANDDNSHGTHVTGTVAGTTNNCFSPEFE